MDGVIPEFHEQYGRKIGVIRSGCAALGDISALIENFKALPISCGDGGSALVSSLCVASNFEGLAKTLS